MSPPEDLCEFKRIFRGLFERQKIVKSFSLSFFKMLSRQKEICVEGLCALMKVHGNLERGPSVTHSLIEC